MPAETLTETELLDAGIEVLQKRLPPNWTVEKVSLGGAAEPTDLIIKSSQRGANQTIFVEAKATVSPRDVQLLMGGPWPRWRRQMGNHPILLMSRYLGPAVRQRLIEEGVSYLDLTGNVRISLDYPGVFIATEGAQRDPAASPAARRGLRGAKAGAVVRVLVDTRPPYGGGDIAKAANVNEGYVSRILETLTDEGLIERESFGPVTGVDWERLIQRRARVVDLFRQGSAVQYVSRQGARAVLDKLHTLDSDPRPTVTGSFAAARLAPVAAPTLLVGYLVAPRDVGERLDLLPAETGADVILLRPDNDIVFSGATMHDGVRWAAPSQVAIDCLAGRGRMPVEGEAVLAWMRDHEAEWRHPSIEAVISAQTARPAGSRG